MSAKLSAMLAAALAYAEKGWHVFPCKPRQKIPDTTRGHLDATTDAATIRQWWTKSPDANIAVNCEASSVVVVDIAPRHGGNAPMAALIAELGPLPATAEARTGGKDAGRHIFFASPAGAKFRGNIGPGIDVKHRGYVLLAPSVHPEGGTYQWIVSP